MYSSNTIYFWDQHPLYRKVLRKYYNEEAMNLYVYQKGKYFCQIFIKEALCRTPLENELNRNL